MFDHEFGNWKNSEVVTAFLEQWQPPVDAVEAVEQPDTSADEYVAAGIELAAFQKRSYGNKIIDELNKIASALGHDSRAAIEVELVIEDIKKELLCNE
jgi:hypothetical protein